MVTSFTDRAVGTWSRWRNIFPSLESMADFEQYQKTKDLFPIHGKVATRKCNSKKNLSWMNDAGGLTTLATLPIFMLNGA